MGNRNSLLHQRVPARTVAVTLIDNLLSYTIKITSNTKRFPKSMRYTITDRLINECVKASGHIRATAKIKIRDKKHYKDVLKGIDKCFDHLARFEGLMVQCKRFCEPGNFEYWSDLLTKCHDELVKWYRHEKQLNADRKRRNKDKLDKDGYIILEETEALRRKIASIRTPPQLIWATRTYSIRDEFEIGRHTLPDEHKTKWFRAIKGQLVW